MNTHSPSSTKSLLGAAATMLLIVGCDPAVDDAVFVSQIARLQTGVVAVAHALNCELDGWVIERLNALHEEGMIPVRVVLVAQTAPQREKRRSTWL